MSTRYKITDPEGAYFLTLTTVGWIDVFTRKAYRDILIESLRFCQEQKGLVLFAYVIMSNHLHLIAQAKDANLGAVIGDFKKYTARKIIDAIQEPGESRREWLLYQLRWFAKQNRKNRSTHQLWQSGDHPVIVYSPKVIWQKLDYLHLNPVKEGWVAAPEHYLYSSATNYAGQESLLEVTILDLGCTEGYVFLGY